MSTSTPHVTVLMATYDGRRYLPDQVASILDQDGVRVELVVSDDGSTDGTREWLQDASADRRLTLLEPAPAGGSAANFYRLLRDVDLAGRDLVAFSDQDDVWLPGRLAEQARLVHDEGYEAVSSNVTAVAPDGTRTLIRKSFPQRRYDYLFESPGPGSTFVFTRRLAQVMQRLLRQPDGAASTIGYHDWLVYAVARAHGWPWLIQDTAWVDYRQHETNVMGANVGAAAARERWAGIRSGWHRGEALTLARVCREIATGEQRRQLHEITPLLASRGPRARLGLIARANQLRRRPRDRAVLAGLIGTGLW